VCAGDIIRIGLDRGKFSFIQKPGESIAPVNPDPVALPTPKADQPLFI
jgi:hypothetical protein